MLRLIATVGTIALLAGAVAVPSPAAADDVEQIGNGTFDTGIPPWTSYGVAAGSTKLVEGALCTDAVDGTVNPWNAAIVLGNLPGVAGEPYALSFKAKASVNVTVKAIFQHGSGAFEQAVSGSPAVGTAFQTYRFTGTSPVSFGDGQVAFQIGGKGAFTFCIDDVSLRGGVAAPPYEPDTGPRVRVNQVGYLPNGPKAATLVTSATTPVDWELAAVQRLPHLLTAHEWNDHVTWLMYEHGRHDGYAEGFRAGYAASERDTADAWRPLAERIRRFAGQKTWDQILDHRAESERAAITAAQQRQQRATNHGQGAA